ncbi:MAG: M23 family metallopeptidase [Lachnospiraceae bacterium]|nr:M23 family metallopeptidase [Lachnospiraceae bacterium]
MKRNRRDNMRRERIIMVTSSAFVLTALTMTGLFMKGQEMKQLDDGYTLDFSALQNNTDNRLNAIGSEQAKTQAGNSTTNIEDDLDYLPMEDDETTQVGSGLVEIPGLTDKTSNAPTVRDDEEGTRAGDKAAQKNEQPEGQGDEGIVIKPEEQTGAQAAEKTVLELHYSEEQGLTKPVNGDVLMPYKMDGSVYFATLDQYKYNPATLFSAEVGSEVYACAEGKIIEVFETAELGKGITMELGDGYTVTYGQLDDIEVVEGEFVQAGEKIGTVASPSRYYVQEGTNLYFCMEKDNKPMNAEVLF